MPKDKSAVEGFPCTNPQVRVFGLGKGEVAQGKVCAWEGSNGVKTRWKWRYPPDEGFPRYSSRRRSGLWVGVGGGQCLGVPLYSLPLRPVPSLSAATLI